MDTNEIINKYYVTKSGNLYSQASSLQVMLFNINLFQKVHYYIYLLFKVKEFKY